MVVSDPFEIDSTAHPGLPLCNYNPVPMAGTGLTMRYVVFFSRFGCCKDVLKVEYCYVFIYILCDEEFFLICVLLNF